MNKALASIVSGRIQVGIDIRKTRDVELFS